MDFESKILTDHKLLSFTKIAHVSTTQLTPGETMTKRQLRQRRCSRRNCCCTKGEAWGSTGDCEACPAPGTQAFDRLCPLGMGRGGNGEDFNECAMMKDLCSGGSCINTDGSYRCECPKGFDLDTTGSRCTDMDECVLNSRICGNGTCTNVEGGFDCACASGYAPGFSGIACLFFSQYYFNYRGSTFSNNCSSRLTNNFR